MGQPVRQLAKSGSAPKAGFAHGRKSPARGFPNWGTPTAPCGGGEETPGPYQTPGLVGETLTPDCPPPRSPARRPVLIMTAQTPAAGAVLRRSIAARPS